MGIHVALLAMPVAWRIPTIDPGIGGQPDPIVLNLNSDEKPLRLIENNPPAERPVDPDTDLIAEQNSNAGDDQDEQGERLAPRLEKPSEHDQMAVLPEAPAEAQEPVPAEEEAESVAAGDTPEPEAAEPGAQLAEVRTADPAEPAEKSEPTLLAKAAPVPVPEPALEPQEAMGRPDGGVKGRGFIGFEAKQHEFAPYVKEVRRAVEKRWKALVSIRYSGSSPTEAVVNCAIKPNGELAFVTVKEAGDSATFAAMCKEAIETAAPFPPFPFKVPRVYRTDNLEIRWTFSFLQK
jgi:TonB C terminal